MPKSRLHREWVCGTYNGYTNGCRCNECKKARSEYRKNYEEHCQLGFGEKKLPISALLKFTEETDTPTLAKQLGIEEDTVRAWHTRPCGINPYRADYLAAKLGVHPSAIWGDDWFRIPFRLTKREVDIILA